MPRRQKDGVLQAYWSKARKHGRRFDTPGDIVYDWGDGCAKADGSLLHYALSSKRFGGIGKDDEPSFLEELQKRGYDLTTIRFSIALKPDTREAERLRREQYEREEAARREANERALYERLKAKYEHAVPPDERETDVSDTPKTIDLMLALKTSLRVLRPDEPCAHPGCLSHVSHPCEGCGRVAGRYPEHAPPTHEEP